MTQFRSALVITLLFRLQSLVIIYTITMYGNVFRKLKKIVGNLIHTFDSLFQIVWKRYQLFSKLELFLYALIITQIVQNFHSQLERKKQNLLCILTNILTKNRNEHNVFTILHSCFSIKIGINIHYFNLYTANSISSQSFQLLPI